MKNKNIFKLITAIFLVAMISLAGCQKMEIVKTIGFIQGQVFDGNTNAPLDSVKIVWSVVGVKDSVTASADEGYLISDLPTGRYSIWGSKANYTTIVTDIEIGGNFDLSNTTVRGGANKEQIITYNPNLYPLNASLKGRVFKNDNGANVPLQGAIIQLDYNGLYNQDDDNYRFVPNLYEATTDADGYYTFTNVPATDVYIRFLDYTDTNGEVYFDNSTHGTSSRRLYLNSGQTYAYAAITLGLASYDYQIRLTSTNAWSAPNTSNDNFAVADDITLEFNMDVSETNTTTRGYVYLETTSGYLVSATISYTDNVITINPDEDLSENTNYRIRYDVYADETNSISSTLYFKTVNNAVIPAQVANFGIAYDYMGTGWLADYNTTGVWFSFDMIANAETYEVYAKDNFRNSDYIKIGTYNQSDFTQGLFHAWVSLPSQFDYYFDDGVQTPFSHGTEVTYKVRAVNSAGEGSFSDIVTVKDETSFDSGDLNIDNTQSSSADNSTGGTTLTITMTFSVSSGRYADVSVIPNVRLWNGATEITPFSSTVVWDNHQRGTITFDVPANTDYSGMELRLHNVTDSSGNTMDSNDYEAETLY